MTRFASPWAFAALIVIIPLVYVWLRSRRRPPVLVHADLGPLAGVRPTWRVHLAALPRVLRVAFLILAVLALARPQFGLRSEQIKTFGVDIAIVLDRSSSMRALDLTPDRLGVAKRTIREFLLGRESDRAALVPFAREAYSASPLTLDHSSVLALVDELGFATRAEDGTAIGLGLAAAINRLGDSNATSKVVILVTDGVNNAGEIAPLTAAELAEGAGIKVYTIGVGTRGVARIPVQDPRGRWVVVDAPVEIDEETLQAIAARTGGRYYRADRDGKLEEIFSEIDTLEKTEIESTIHVDWSDRFEGWLLAAAAIFLLELLARLWLARLP